ncbi:phosphoadenosine phosphosulfate reductase family protein [Citromicrobium bathyomarinum]|nr:phosphoadenosine phosphosulfate reductase family protein [Citromicrobium sp. JL2201]KPM21971.1 hypothetical protein VO57_14030 [Citromicrobium sp. JL2201]
MAAFGHIASDPAIDEEIAAGAWVIFNLSGGKDCGAVSSRTMRYLDGLGHPRARRFAIHADLGRAEHTFNPSQVEAQARALGLRLDVVRAKSGDLVDRFENRWTRGLQAYVDLRLFNLRGPWSSPSLKFCQSEKKIQVMGPHLARELRGHTIINVVGIRREESPARAKTEVAKLDTRFAKPGNKHGTKMMLWHPGVELLEDEVFDINRRDAIPLSPIYGRGATRHSCALCTMGSLNDLAIGAEAHPWLYRHYVSMEATTTFSFQSRRWLADIRPELLSAGLLADIDRAKALSTERREIEAALPARHRFVKGWPHDLPTLEEAEQIAAGRARILAHHGAENTYPTAQHIRDRFAELLAQKPSRRTHEGPADA